MSTANAQQVFTAQAVVSMSPQHVAQLLQSKAATIATLEHRLAWFERQLFGKKSERFASEPDPQQMHLGELLGQLPGELAAPAQQPPEAATTVPAHTRRKSSSDFTDEASQTPFFDEAVVPVQTIEVPNAEVQALQPEQYEVIGHKVSHRLAQRPGSFVVLKYVRPVINRLDTQTLHCPPAPAGVIDGSRADVSFIVGLLVDKFRYHLPLYRQLQRLLDAGFNLSRPWLTQLVQLGSQLLEPIFDAQLTSICSGHVITMNEVPVKAGQAGNGQMKATYFWPVYGDQDEVCFPHFESRRHEHVEQALGARLAPGTVLLSDGYGAYLAYAKKMGITNAQCWAHARRGIFEAKEAQPQAADSPSSTGPTTVSHHAPDCPSYEPPAEFSGLGHVLGSAIIEDPDTGETTLKLDFPLTKIPGRSQMRPAACIDFCTKQLAPAMATNHNGPHGGPSLHAGRAGSV